MNSFQLSMMEYKKRLEKGIIRQAYKGLMDYMKDLRIYLQKNYPDYLMSGNIYYGFMDMTYFSFTPQTISNRKLKIAIVFNHENFRFEAWLSGVNKQVQSKYWKLIKSSGWNKYKLVQTIEGMDSIIEYVLVDNPDFSDLAALTQNIERGVFQFTRDVENFLADH